MKRKIMKRKIMKRKIMKRKIVSLALALLMIVAFAGCGTSETEESTTTSLAEQTESTAETTAAQSPAALEIAEPANLVCYMPGDLPVDLPAVMEKVAPILKERINATVEFHGVPWADHATKYPLIMASGEDCDMIFTSDWSFYNEFITKNALAPLDDLLADFAPVVLEKMAPDYLQSARVDGKLYMIPSNFPSFQCNGYIVRGDLMDKYGVKDDIKNYKDYFACLRAIKPEVGMLPLDTRPDDSLMFNYQQENRDRIVAYKPNSFGYYQILADGTVRSALDDPGAVELIKEARKAYNDGLWSKSILSSQTNANEAFDNGKSGSLIWNVYGADTARKYAAQKGLNWDVRFYLAGSDLPLEMMSARQGGISVPQNSKYAKRALMLLNEINKDFDLWKLFYWGIEGEHYVINDKNERVLPEGKTSEDIQFQPGAWAFAWGINSTEFYYYYDDPYRSEDTDTLLDRAAENGKFTNLTKYGFSFNAENVKAEDAAVTAALTTYFQPLIWGAVDPEENIQVAREKLDAAGFETVRAEYEKQIEDFMAKNNLTTLYD